MRWIYLDYNATTPLAPAAQQSMLPYLADRYADPRADHAQGRVVAEALDDARTRVAGAIHADADEIGWTCSGTESCGAALRGVIEPALRRGEKPHLVVSAVEHAAVSGPARFLASIGAELTVVPTNASGRVSASAVLDALRPETRLVSLVLANEHLGVVQPVAEIARACRNEAVLVHTDATQAFGKLSIDVGELGVDLLSLSAHKAYGPKGVGALYVRRDAALDPAPFGTSADVGHGMPNVSGVVGFGAAAEVAVASLAESTPQLLRLRDRLSDALLSGAGGGTVLSGTGETDLANTLCVSLPGVVGGDLLAAAPDIAATPCATGTPDDPRLNPTLTAVGLEPRSVAGAIRLSVGWYTDEEEVDRAASTLLSAWDQLRA